MVRVEANADLSNMNTFKIKAVCRHLIRFTDESTLPGILKSIVAYDGPVMFLGGGSNVLFTGDYPGMVVKVENRGMEIIDEDNDYVYIRAAAGEQWDNLVEYAVDRGYGGLENLSMIPGTVGSSPIQNIGAYGAELKDVFYMLEAVSVRTGEFREFYRNECQFDYRFSVFKGVYKGIYLILSVIFKLSKRPVLNLSYAAVEQEMYRLNLPFNIASVRKAVISIRQSKLPDPEVTGNAGSFFKNPVIEEGEFRKMLSLYPDLRYFSTTEGYKLAAGWLIESCGWKGYREEFAGVHHKQALVLVNHGDASGMQLKQLAMRIKDSVYDRYGVVLEPEVNII